MTRKPLKKQPNKSRVKNIEDNGSLTVSLAENETLMIGENIALVAYRFGSSVRINISAPKKLRLERIKEDGTVIGRSGEY